MLKKLRPTLILPFLFLECTDPNYPWALTVIVPDQLYLCKIFHVSSVLQGFNTHAHEISVRKILSGNIRASASHPGGTNGDVQYDLSTLVFNNGEQLEYFSIKILRL